MLPFLSFGFNTIYNKNKSGQREESVADRSEMNVKTRAHLELSMMLCRRWAMVRTVQWENSLRMVAWIRSSVSRSTAAVASSRIKMRDFLNRARARHNSCLCPTLWKEWHVQKMCFWREDTRPQKGTCWYSLNYTNFAVIGVHSNCMHCLLS